MTQPSRNAPCPCGSGLKFKKCCIGKRLPVADGETTRGGMYLGVGVVALIIIGGIMLVTPASEDTDTTGTVVTPTPITRPGSTQQIIVPQQSPVTIPQQQPPANSGLPQRTGRPWEYDAATNSHWDPSPGHEHWHSGPVPPR